MLNQKTASLPVLLVLAIGISTIPALAQETAPPLHQWSQGTPIEEIRCGDQKILLESPRGRPACVTEPTSQRLLERGFVLIGQADRVQTDEYASLPGDISGDASGSEIAPAILSDRMITIMGNPVNPNKSSEIGQTDYWPKYNVTFPHNVRVGEPFDVVWDYTYVIPDDDGSYEEFEEQCEAVYCERFHSFHILSPTYVDFEHELATEFALNTTDYVYTPHRSWNTYDVDPPYDNTGPLQERFTFTVNEPDIPYRHGELRVDQPGNSAKIYFFVGQDGIVHLDDEFIRPAVGTPGYTSTGAPDDPAHTLTKTVSPKGSWVVKNPSDGPPMDYFAEYLREGGSQVLRDMYTTDGFTDYERMFRDSNFTSSWISKFVKIYPEFSSQLVLPALNWILPVAYGAGPPTTIESQK